MSNQNSENEQDILYGWFSKKAASITGYYLYTNQNGKVKVTIVSTDEICPYGSDTDYYKDSKFVGKVCECVGYYMGLGKMRKDLGKIMKGLEQE